MVVPAENIGGIREAIQSLVRHCQGDVQPKPLDHDFYQQCVDEAGRRGYPVDGSQSVRTYLREGVVYATNCIARLDGKLQIWVALYTSCSIFVDDLARGTSEVSDIYQFNNRFIQGQPQQNMILEALADLLRETPVYFEPVPCNLITTSFLNFITANLLEYETKDMNISSDAQHYPGYSRALSGLAEAYAFCVFPHDIPIKDYIQAIPELALFLTNMNDVLSFYKEEKEGEVTNQISLLAARNNTSKLEVFDAMTESTADLYTRIMKILEGSAAACEAFKHFAAGYITFHVSLTRYQLVELEL